jgi:hypothetical protein
MLASTWEVWHHMPKNGNTLPLLSAAISTWTENRIRDLLFFFDPTSEMILSVKLCSLLKSFII